VAYKNDAYYAIERNFRRHQTAKDSIDSARTLMQFTYASEVRIVGKDRDGRDVSIALSGDLKSTIIDAGAEHCIKQAEAIHSGEWEPSDYRKAAAI